MLIGIDASRATTSQRTGTEGYSLHIIRGLIAIGGEHRFRLYFRDTPGEALLPESDCVETVVIEQPRLWTHRGLGPAVRRTPPDVLFVPAHVVPWPNTGQCPAVFTAHDLGYLHYPEKHPLFARLYLNWSTRHSARIARRVISVSNATRYDLIQLNGVPDEKIRVVHSGVDEHLRPVVDREEIEALKRRLGIPGPYVLHVGSIQPRKNLTRLVEAFAQVKDAVEGLSLVLAGRPGWNDGGLLERAEQADVAGRVILPGFVADEDLAALYSGAAAYAFPSLYEGFGFPALEAMACGTPVVCANTSSLPEIVGNAALMFAPTDVPAFAEALRRVLVDEKLRADMVARGTERAKQFTWASASQATMDVLEEAATI